MARGGHGLLRARKQEVYILYGVRLLDGWALGDDEEGVLWRENRLVPDDPHETAIARSGGGGGRSGGGPLTLLVTLARGASRDRFIVGLGFGGRGQRRDVGHRPVPPLLLLPWLLLPLLHHLLLCRGWA